MLNTGKLAGKTIFISGASRGIGKAIALKAAQDGAKIVVAAKTAEPHPKLPGTIYTAAEESKLNPTSAFMTGKLKMEGNLGKALALEKVMKKMNSRGYHTSAASPMRITSTISSTNLNKDYSRVLFPQQQQPKREYSTEVVATFTSVPEVFDRIKIVANAEMVAKVKASYVFDVEGEGKFFIDFTSGDGNVGTGEVPDKPEGYKPDVRIKINKDNCLKMFNRELAPATAFMTGKLKLSGDLAKALSLEAVMKASREASLKAAQGGAQPPAAGGNGTQTRSFHSTPKNRT